MSSVTPFTCLPSHHPSTGPFSRCCWYGLLFAAVMHICIPCTLPWWISVFDTTNKAFHFDGILSQWSHTGWSRCFVSVRWSCLLGLWEALRDRLRQTKVCVCVWQALCHFSFQKVAKRMAFNIHCSRVWEGAIITLQNYHFHAWFPGDTIQLHWQATLSEQPEPDFNWTASQLSFPLIWLSHPRIAFEDLTKPNQRDNHLLCNAVLILIFKNTTDLPCRSEWLSFQTTLNHRSTERNS